MIDLRILALLMPWSRHNSAQKTHFVGVSRVFDEVTLSHKNGSLGVQRSALSQHKIEYPDLRYGPLTARPP